MPIFHINRVFKSHFSQNSHYFKNKIQVNLWTKSVILPQCEDQGRIVVIRIYTPTTVHRRRFLAKSPDRLLNAIYLYLESLGHLQEDTEDNLKTFDSKLTRKDLQDFLAKGGGALYLNKRTH